ncbi:MAG: hypothetical protein ACMUEL_05980 [Flavobacteriales bacterium Tduv]
MIVNSSIIVSFFSQWCFTYVLEDRKERDKKKLVKEKKGEKNETQSGVETQGKWPRNQMKSNTDRRST